MRAFAQCSGCTVTISNNGAAGYTVNDNDVVCIQFNRTTAVNLSNRNNVTVCVDEGFVFSGGFTNYTNTNQLTVNVYGTYRGNLTLNNSLSQFRVLSGGVYDNSGTLTVTSGSALNQGTISRPIVLSNSSVYSNSGTQSGTVTLNQTSTYTNTGTQSGNLTQNNDSNYANSGSHSGTLVMGSGATASNAGSITGNVTLNNNSTFTNTGTKSGVLTLANSATVINSGNLTLTNLTTGAATVSLTNSPSGTLSVTNAVTLRGNVNLAGTITFSGNLTLQDAGTHLTVSQGGQLVIGGTFSVGPNALVTTVNSPALDPETTITASSLTFPNNGGATNREFVIGAHTSVFVTNDTNLDTERAVMNIQGNFETGRDLIISNNGGTSPVRINLNGNGSIKVGRNATIRRDIVASGNSSFTVDGNFTMENTSTYSFDISGNVRFTVQGNTVINQPLNVSGTSTVELNGNLTIPNVGTASLTLNNDVSLTVAGTTVVNRPLVFNGNSVGTFESNVDIPNVGGALLQVNGNGDVLIQGNLTRTGTSGTISVTGAGSLVICNDRAPNGDIEGLFPPATATNVNIAPLPAFYGGCRLLPVEFSYFDVVFRRENREVQVTWATGKEWNNAHFEIERSADGLKTWKTLGAVQGRGWSDIKSDYRFDDQYPLLIGGLLYYRIRQVDFDGRFTYSRTVSVRVPSLIETKGTWIIYPNPVRNQPVRLELVDAQGYHGEVLSIRIIDPLGQAVGKTATNLEDIQIWMSEVLAPGQKGVYVVEISWGKFREYHKVIVRD